MSRTYCFMLILLFSIIGVVFLPHFDLKSFCVLFLSALLFLSFAIVIKSNIPKYFFIILFSLALPLSIIDGYFALTYIKVNYVGENFVEPNEHSGYSLTPNKVVARKLLFNNDIIYDAVYSIDEMGHRKMPFHPHAKIAVVLMGGSFTFGQGLNDTETFSYKLAQNLGENYQVINFGAPAYGPHNMLGIIEAGLPYLKKYDYILTYYTYINTHELRAAGSKRWSAPGPRYNIINGEAIRNGNLSDDPPLFWENGFWTKLDENRFFESLKTMLVPYLLPYNTDEERMLLTQAIIEKSASEIRKINPNSTFTVLAWPPKAMKFLPTWHPNPAIPVIDVGKWLPNSEIDIEQYRLRDLHPNALAASHAAEELTKLVQQDAASLQPK